jgi:hypothetical protein
MLGLRLNSNAFFYIAPEPSFINTSLLQNFCTSDNPAALLAAASFRVDTGMPEPRLLSPLKKMKTNVYRLLFICIVQLWFERIIICKTRLKTECFCLVENGMFLLRKP